MRWLRRGWGTGLRTGRAARRTTRCWPRRAVGLEVAELREPGRPVRGVEADPLGRFVLVGLATAPFSLLLRRVGVAPLVLTWVTAG